MLRTRIAITLESVHWNSRPRIRWNWREYQHEHVLNGEICMAFELDLEETSHIIRFDFFNKTNEDTQDGKDKAVIIKDIQINGISDPKIILASTYRPDYPEPWLSQQDPKPEPILYGQQYLGWNGSWELEFSVPAFKWLHKTMDLGWTYN